MTLCADLALYDASGRLTATAEVKNRSGTSPEWAAQTRRNILAHGGRLNPDFFLLVTPDRLYVWKDAGNDPVECPPNHIADLTPVFAPYFDNAGLNPRNVSGDAFEMLVAAWLSDLTRSSRATKDRKCHQDWLDESGFGTAVRDGRIEYEALV